MVYVEEEGHVVEDEAPAPLGEGPRLSYCSEKFGTGYRCKKSLQILIVLDDNNLDSAENLEEPDWVGPTEQ